MFIIFGMKPGKKIKILSDAWDLSITMYGYAGDKRNPELPPHGYTIDADGFINEKELIEKFTGLSDIQKKRFLGTFGKYIRSIEFNDV